MPVEIFDNAAAAVTRWPPPPTARRADALPSPAPSRRLPSVVGASAADHADATATLFDAQLAPADARVRARRQHLPAAHRLGARLDAQAAGAPSQRLRAARTAPWRCRSACAAPWGRGGRRRGRDRHPVRRGAAAEGGTRLRPPPHSPVATNAAAAVAPGSAERQHARVDQGTLLRWHCGGQQSARGEWYGGAGPSYDHPLPDVAGSVPEIVPGGLPARCYGWAEHMVGVAGEGHRLDPPCRRGLVHSAAVPHCRLVVSQRA